MKDLGYGVNLVVCQKSKIADWCDHFRENYGHVKVFDLTNEADGRRFRQMYLFRSQNDPCLIGVINYELLWRRPNLLVDIPPYCLMLDESSLIQNRKAKQTKYILRMRPGAIILLSGTPTSGKYENLWTQAHLLGWDISESLYQSTFVNWRVMDIGGNVPIKVVDKRHPYRNEDRLKRKLREHGAVFMKTDEVMDMPDQNIVIHKVDPPKEYRAFMKDGVVMMGGEPLIGDTTLTKHLRARQLCGQWCAGKTEALRDLLSSTNDRVVVFYNFTPELHRILTVCEDMGRPVSVVNGETKDLSAYENDGDSVTVCQYQAAAMGLNLQKANVMVYFTLPERSDLFEQSKKRIHRIGQKRPCFYHVLMCRNTIEGDIWDCLEKRRDYTDYLFREDDRG